MKPYFNISSAGGSATTWLTNLLNKHPEIVAFHGLRVNPLDHSEWLSPERMMGFLSFLRDHQGAKLCDEIDKKTFGIIHTYYGTEIRENIKRAGGSFMAIFRDPVMRINSLFHHHYRDIQHVNLIEDNAYKTVAEMGHLSSQNTSNFQGLLNEDLSVLSDTERMFRDRVKEVLSSDMANYFNSDTQEHILYEKMVSSAAYCFDKLSFLTGQNSDQLHDIINNELKKPVFSHSKSKLVADQVYEQWPVQFKNIFKKEISRQGKDRCCEIYANLGYEETVEYVCGVS